MQEQCRALANRGVGIGTSSWKYSGWRGQLYADDRYCYRGRFSEGRFQQLCLADYARVFPTVCVDATYYKFPERSRDHPGHAGRGQERPGGVTRGFPEPPGDREGLDISRMEWHFRIVLADKYEQLCHLIRSFGSCLVAYSGGVDSVLLAWVCRKVLADRALAVIADSPSLPRRELADALAIAERYGILVRVIRTKEFDNPSYLANPANRCYFCKFELFTELTPIARAEGYPVILYGENASDAGDLRPGAQAASEFLVRAPLKEVGLTKAEIRTLSAQLGLPTADKPQMACLSSRIPYGEVVTPEKLHMIERAENRLRDLGFHDVRVRHHELKQGSLARIEIGPQEIQRLLANGSAAQVAAALRETGYAHVTLDLLGYRRGSANEALPFPAAANPPGGGS